MDAFRGSLGGDVDDSHTADRVHHISHSAYTLQYQGGTFLVDRSQYQQLADAFLHGRIWIDAHVPDWLAAMDNPYDEQARGTLGMQTGDPSRWDWAFYHGRYYCYFGPLPALLLFAPFDGTDRNRSADRRRMRVPCDTGMRFAHIPHRNTVEALLAWHPQMARGPRLHRNRSGIRIDVSGARPMVLFDSHPRIARTRARRHRIVGTLFRRWPSHPTHSVHRHRFDACRAHHRLLTGVHPHRGIRHHPPMAANPNPRYPVHPVPDTPSSPPSRRFCRSSSSAAR